MDFVQAISDQLDRDEPQWFIRWATGSDLEAYALSAGQPGAKQMLKDRIAKRIFHRVLNCAIAVGAVKE